VSDRPIDEGWWQASDGMWYPPETHPSRHEQDETWRRGTFSVLPDEPPPAPRAAEPADLAPADDLSAQPGSEAVPTDGLFASGTAAGPAPWSPAGGSVPGADATPADVTSGDAPTADLPTADLPPSPFAPPEGGPDLIYGSPPPPGTRSASPPSGHRPVHDITPAPPPAPEPEQPARRGWLLAGAAVAVVAVGLGAFFLTRDDSSDEGGPASVASETTLKEATGQSQPEAAAGDPDAKCRAALLSDDEARPFQECDAYQFRRLQPVVAPERTDLDTACKVKTLGDACIFIPTTLPPAPFEPSTVTGQGNGSVPMPAVASGGIVEVHYNGPGTIAVSSALGPLASHDGPYVGRHYVGDVQAGQDVQVTAQGSWTVVVLPPTSARDATLRAVGDGPDVLRIDNPTEKQVRFTYDGTDRYQVIGHPMTGKDTAGSVAIDQPGPVDSTVTLHGNLIEIRGTGHWTIVPS